MSSRVQQTKQQQQANAKALRQLAKESATCADCKRNDPRWASWNIGCFLCIRCSGIHRSMGTHISKVKSIDLDIWTQEQMDSMQKWGNQRANLYWEAHLKTGHAPPEHKVESFIRSKYETRRWAMDGPPPQDPSVLDGASSATASTSASVPKPATPSTSSPRTQTISSSTRGQASRTAAPATAIDLLGGDAGPAGPAAPVVTKQQPQRSLFDEDDAPLRSGGRPPNALPQMAQKAAPASAATKSSNSGAGGGLFDLDWHEPPPQQAKQGGQATVDKSNILSLFNNSSKPAGANFGSPTSPTNGSSTDGGFGGLDAFGGLDIAGNKTAAAGGNSTSGADLWGTTNAASSTNKASGAGSSDLLNSASVWGATSPAQTRQASNSFSSSSNKPSSTSMPMASTTDTSADIWGDFASTTTPAAASSSSTGGAKDDPFGDIWK